MPPAANGWLSALWGSFGGAVGGDGRTKRRRGSLGGYAGELGLGAKFTRLDVFPLPISNLRFEPRHTAAFERNRLRKLVLAHQFVDRRFRQASRLDDGRQAQKSLQCRGLAQGRYLRIGVRQVTRLSGAMAIFP